MLNKDKLLAYMRDRVTALEACLGTVTDYTKDALLRMDGEILELNHWIDRIEGGMFDN